MDEKDLTIQKLTQANLVLLQELHTIKECFTCSHYGEIAEHCDEYMFGHDCRDYKYEWRGVKAAQEWYAEQENIRQAELRMDAMAEAEEDDFERRMGER